MAGVGCAALAEHLRAMAWPPKFRPHLPEKYDGTTNPSEFLQVYVTAITATGGNDAVMASYFHCSLDWASPDLAHEPHSWDDSVLGGALCEVHYELRQCVPAVWCGGSPPRREAETRRDAPGIHLSLQQGMGYHSSYP